MQIKTRSTLPTGAFFLQVTVLLDLVILVCVLTVMTSRVGMEYGYEVKAPASGFLMNIVGDVEFISVTAGEQPSFYLGNRLIEGGLSGADGSDRMSIALRLDSSVSHGLREQLENMGLSRGMKCYIATEPAD